MIFYRLNVHFLHIWGRWCPHFLGSILRLSWISFDKCHQSPHFQGPPHYHGHLSFLMIFFRLLGHIHFWNTNYFWSRLNFWCCINLLGSLQFWGCPHFLGRSHLWGCLHFWASLHFGGCLHVLGRDTSFLACFWHTKKYLQEVLSLKVGKCIHFLNNMWFKDLFFP